MQQSIHERPFDPINKAHRQISPATPLSSDSPNWKTPSGHALADKRSHCPGAPTPRGHRLVSRTRSSFPAAPRRRPPDFLAAQRAASAGAVTRSRSALQPALPGRALSVQRRARMRRFLGFVLRGAAAGNPLWRIPPALRDRLHGALGFSRGARLIAPPPASAKLNAGSALSRVGGRFEECRREANGAAWEFGGRGGRLEVTFWRIQILKLRLEVIEMKCEIERLERSIVRSNQNKAIIF